MIIDDQCCTQGIFAPAKAIIIISSVARAVSTPTTIAIDIPVTVLRFN